MSATIDLVFQALADPTRRAMVERLSRGHASVTELASPLRMSLPAVVQHLRSSKPAGSSARKNGGASAVRLEASALLDAENWIARGGLCGSAGSIASPTILPETGNND